LFGRIFASFTCSSLLEDGCGCGDWVAYQPIFDLGLHRSAAFPGLVSLPLINFIDQQQQTTTINAPMMIARFPVIRPEGKYSLDLDTIYPSLARASIALFGAARRVPL
jgi:hypothetical protein